MKNIHATRILVLIFVVLTLGIVAAGCFVYQGQRDNCRMDAEEKLAAVADLKVNELATWRNERMADASVFYKNTAFTDEARRLIEQPQNLSAQEDIRSWLTLLQAAYHYDRVALLDASCNERMSVPDTKTPHSPLTLQKAHEAMRSGQLTFADFYPDEYTKKNFLRLFVPILAGPSGSQPLGVLILRIDPTIYFYPFIQRWPTPSETAETLLIRREGNEVVYLNELRHKTGTTLTLKAPITSKELPAVRAALGQEGIVEGVDYRGVPVLGALRAVPDSPWFLVAKMDLAEVYSPMQQAFWIVVFFVGMLLFGVAAAVAFVWRQQQALFYRDQAEAAKALRDVNAKLAITLNSIGDAVISTDLAGNIVQMNSVAETLTGWTLAEAAGRPLADVFHILNAQTRQPAPNPVARVLETGQIVGLANHTVLLARDGTEYQIGDSAAPICDANGPTQGVVLVFRDVTQEYAAAEALRESQGRIRKKMAAILLPEGDIGSLELADIVDTTALQHIMEDYSRITQFSTSIADLHGNTLVAAGGQDICAKFHGVHPEACNRCLRSHPEAYHCRPESDATDSAGVKQDSFTMYKCHNGLWDARAPIIVGGAHLGYVFVGQLLFDDEAVDYDVFRTQARQFGFDEKEYLTALDHVPRRSQEAVDAAMAFCTRLANLVSALSYSNIKLSRTVSERARIEDCLLESKAELQQYAATLELSNQALEESSHRAEAANRAKSEFLANMSHELRTPLNAIIGFSEGLLERVNRHPLNEHQIDRIGKIKTSGDHLLELINGVLDIAKVESGKVDLHIMTFDVKTVMQEVADLAEALAKDKPAIRFVLDIEENLPPIASDHNMIRQILVNLLSNAIKFTEQGSVTLRVCQNSDSLLLSVKDTGVGISAENQARLFEQFYQVHQKIHRSLKGTGLGLSLSRKFAELLGGTLTAESVEGQGSTFTLTVPLVFERRKSVDRRHSRAGVSPAQAARCDAGVSPAQAARCRAGVPPAQAARCDAGVSPAPKSSTPEGQERRRVLCIEANPANSELLNDYLTEAGYQVIMAANGTEGLSLAASEHPHAIILDVMLPNDEGWGILYRLKDNLVTSDIPVIVATGVDEQRLGQFLGANDYLVKPVGKSQILQAIERASRNPERNVRNVAVVDDDPCILRLVGHILEKQNYQVCTYESGEAFLASLATLQPDVAVVDLIMPHMDGFQVIERLREHPVCPDIPVVVMTAKSLTEDDYLRLDHSVCAVLREDGASCQETMRELVDQLQLLETGKESAHESCSLG